MEYLSALTQGILWGIMGIGLYISFRILRTADLTSEASFTMGAAVAVRLITSGQNPLLACLAAILAGSLAGLITGVLMTFFEIPPLLSSIITMTGLYSINLRILGKPNLSTRGSVDIFSLTSAWIQDINLNRALIGLIFVVLIIVLLTYFFQTDLGQALIATGDNEVMANSLGIKANTMKRLGLMMANGIIALSGALVAQDNSFADISMGTGTVVVAFASIVIGEVLMKNLRLPARLIMVVVGSMIYRMILVFVLNLGFDPTDFRLVSALVLAIFLAYPSITKKIRQAHQDRKEGI